MNTQIGKLEKELNYLREYHKSIWDTYGSELSAGDMMAREKELEKQIAALKKEIDIEDKSHVIDD
jgi:hypothetical protein